MLPLHALLRAARSAGRLFPDRRSCSALRSLLPALCRQRTAQGHHQYENKETSHSLGQRAEVKERKFMKRAEVKERKFMKRAEVKEP